MEFLKNLESNPLALGGLLVVGVAILWYAMRLRARTDAPSDRLSASARVFLVLLRLVIGWHFLVEGLEKLHSPNWSSEGYLRESVGPLAPQFRNLAGDSVVAMATLVEGDQEALSPALVQEWQRYFDAFASHYSLDETQRKTAQAKFAKAQADMLVWMTKPRSVTKPGSIPPEITVEWNMPDRLKELKKMQARLAEVESTMPERGEKSWKDWKDAKADLAKWRGAIKKDLDGQTEAFKKSLTDTLSADQKTKKDPLTGPIPRPFDWHNHLDVADHVVKYGLVGIGVCLIAGCFTRIAALGGAALLFSFYLAMPSLPYLPESPKSEGHYVYINKNIIEMIALLALASLQTGRWAGVDGILQFFNPLNWPKKKKPAVAAAGQKVVIPATAGATKK